MFIYEILGGLCWRIGAGTVSNGVRLCGRRWHVRNTGAVIGMLMLGTLVPTCAPAPVWHAGTHVSCISATCSARELRDWLGLWGVLHCTGIFTVCPAWLRCTSWAIVYFAGPATPAATVGDDARGPAHVSMHAGLVGYFWPAIVRGTQPAQHRCPCTLVQGVQGRAP